MPLIPRSIGRDPSSLSNTDWLRSPTGLLIPHAAERHPSPGGQNAPDAPSSKRERLLNAARDWSNSLATVISAFAAILALGLAVASERQQQIAERERRHAEQLLLQQTRLQTQMQMRLAQLQMTNTELQMKNVDLEHQALIEARRQR